MAKTSFAATDVIFNFTTTAQEEVKKKKVVRLKQPCCQPGLFTTTGVGRGPVKKKCTPSAEEVNAVIPKAGDAASRLADGICATNPACPDAEFVKYTNVKQDCQGTELVVEVTVQWHCVKKAKKDEKPKKDSRKIPAGPVRPILTERTRRTR